MARDLINGLRVNKIFEFFEKIENVLSSSSVDSSVHEHREPVAENQFYPLEYNEFITSAFFLRSCWNVGIMFPDYETASSLSYQ